MKVVITGSRHGFPRNKIKARLSQLPKDAVIIEGGADGVDKIARSVAEELGLDLIEIPANWKRYGNSAGPIRNRRMIDLLSPEDGLVIAFHENIAQSRGTADCLKEANRRAIPTEHIS